MKNSAGRGGCYPPRPNSIIGLLFIQNIFKRLKEKMSFTFNNFAPVRPFFSPRRKPFVKLPLTPPQL